MKARRIPLSVILSTYRPTDMLPGSVSRFSSTRELWEAVFDSIERNHVPVNPAHWAAFCAKVAKRQWTPITLDEQAKTVLNGHHRVWALFKAGAASVRAV